jgi:signal transduction histidine kinase
MEELLDILLDNAGKYTGDGGLITVSCTREGQWIELIVQDTGQGIAADELPRVFDRFYRAKRHVSQTGSGLGLSIAQKIVERAQGTMEVQSRLGLGTKVIVRLPAQPGVYSLNPSMMKIHHFNMNERVERDESDCRNPDHAVSCAGLGD